MIQNNNASQNNTLIHDEVGVSIEKIMQIAESSLNLQNKHTESVLNNNSSSPDEIRQASKQAMKISNACKNLALVNSGFQKAKDNELMALNSIDKKRFDECAGVAENNFKGCRELFSSVINDLADNKFFNDAIEKNEVKQEFWEDVMRVDVGLDFSKESISGLSDVMWDGFVKPHSVKEATTEYYNILHDRFNQEYDALKNGLKHTVNKAYEGIENEVVKGVGTVVQNVQAGAGAVFAAGGVVMGKVDDGIVKAIDKINLGTDKFLAAKDVLSKGISHANIKIDQGVDEYIVSPVIDIANFVFEHTKKYTSKFKDIVKEAVLSVKEKYSNVSNAVSEVYETSLNDRVKARKEAEKNYDVIPRPAFKNQ